MADAPLPDSAGSIPAMLTNFKEPPFFDQEGEARIVPLRIPSPSQAPSQLHQLRVTLAEYVFSRFAFGWCAAQDVGVIQGMESRLNWCPKDVNQGIDSRLNGFAKDIDGFAKDMEGFTTNMKGFAKGVSSRRDGPARTGSTQSQGFVNEIRELLSIMTIKKTTDLLLSNKA